MGATRVNKIPIALAILVLLILISLWSGRDGLPHQPLHYIKGKLGKRPSFYEIANIHGTDKVTTHHYQQMYEHRLAPFRDKPIKMLEVGLGCDMNYGPGASYYTWLDYFTKVDLYYIEYDAACAKQWANKTTGATIFTGDQADVAFLEEFLREAGSNWDIIIDDGGHTMIQQQTTLSVLWPHVKASGIYFIEDLGTSYQANYGGAPDSPTSMMADLKKILDDLNKMGPDKSPISEDVVDFEFTQEVVALTKRDDYVLPDVI
ncbi:hypothetical protein G7Y89_g12880 [Cudoniella acicularis]|uniref:Hard-surface induced protein 5 n=1 Tax=Cudoniella acicularis TaxID=354080 RepID=A0A8H4VYR7_9HELO|nr:hypothetical protein G7Y89_g12880 [Cudoniella acicularis]